MDNGGRPVGVTRFANAGLFVATIALSVICFAALTFGTSLGDGERISFREAAQSGLRATGFESKAASFVDAPTSERDGDPITQVVATPTAIWTVMYTRALARFAPDTLDLVFATEPEDTGETLALAADDRAAWLATTNGLYRVDAQTNATRPVVTQEAVLGVALDGTTTWATTAHELLRINDERVQSRRPLPSGAIGTTALVTAGGAVWLLDSGHQDSLPAHTQSAAHLWRLDEHSARPTLNLIVTGARSMAFAGNAIWVRLPGELLRVDATTLAASGETLGPCDVFGPLTSDGQSLWAASSSFEIVHIDPSNGRAIDATGIPYNSPALLAVSGMQMEMVNAGSPTSFAQDLRVTTKHIVYHPGALSPYDGPLCRHRDVTVGGARWHAFGDTRSVRFSTPGRPAFTVAIGPAPNYLDAADITLLADGTSRVWVVRGDDVLLVDLGTKRVVGSAALTELTPFTARVDSSGLVADHGLGTWQTVSRRDFTVETCTGTSGRATSNCHKGA